MSLLKKMISVMLAAGIGIMPAVPVNSSAVKAEDEKTVYIYDTTKQEKSKEQTRGKNEPFNVFDIYDAYYKIISQNTTNPVTTTSATTSATTTTAEMTTSSTSAKTKRTTTAKTTKTTKATTSATSTTTTEATTSATTTEATTSATTTEAETSTTTTLTTAATTTVTTQVGQFPNGEYKNGIDVSQWQWIIDWQAVKNSGQVDYAIIKAGWGKHANQIDPFFRANMEQAQAAGIDVGIYWFSYAMSVEEAKQEALACMEVIKDYSFNYPVYYDFEYQYALNNLSYATLSAMIEVFCTTLEENGYNVGVYGSGSDLEYRIYRHVLEKRPVWVAEYDTPNVAWYKGTYGMWQYSPRGRIDGISYDVDLNYCYVDYPSIIGVNPQNGKIPEPVTTTAPTTATTEPAVTTTAYSLECNVLDIDDSSAAALDDFNKEEYGFAMLRVGSEDIEELGECIDKAHSLGIDCGVIYDCCSSDVELIRKDMTALEAQLGGRRLEYPLYFGLTAKNADFGMYGFEKNNAASIATEFCSYFEGRKYYVGIMAEDKALSYRFNSSLLSRYDVWQVKYNNDPSLYKADCGIRSFADAESGEIRTVCVTDYPEIIKRIGLNGYST